MQAPPGRQSQTATIFDLPPELIDRVATYLDLGEIKRARFRLNNPRFATHVKKLTVTADGYSGLWYYGEGLAWRRLKVPISASETGLWHYGEGQASRRSELDNAHSSRVGRLVNEQESIERWQDVIEKFKNCSSFSIREPTNRMLFDPDLSDYGSGYGLWLEIDNARRVRRDLAKQHYSSSSDI
ncbi:uncharacterized protein DSM5745_09484 [Aspergillus mulundensis]|uniref:F-box domain-containing protein n=1 Tax=Aspergillus mulundensis TaxID=1810919 RepID=A0A3D8QVF1_9EURO|nr:hypothetical protein DSM5745_09484 [Aspergillus mulundensis]RDW65745.1 hypothetical protein DSM5745_09484 [Aspergillus mulundensis]